MYECVLVSNDLNEKMIVHWHFIWLEHYGAITPMCLTCELPDWLWQMSHSFKWDQSTCYGINRN